MEPDVGRGLVDREHARVECLTQARSSRRVSSSVTISSTLSSIGVSASEDARNSLSVFRQALDAAEHQVRGHGGQRSFLRQPSRDELVGQKRQHPGTAPSLAPIETHEITELIARLRSEAGYTILVIEHDMHVVEGISDRVVALDHGVKIVEGTFEQVATDPRVIEAYLGTKAAATK